MKLRFLEILNIAFLNLLENKFKVLLTSLGIIVGTTTIIMVLAIGSGGEAEVKKQFEGLNAGSIYINLDFSNPDLKVEKVKHLDEEKMQFILGDSDKLKNVALNVSGNSSVKILGKDDFEPVVGITKEFDNINNFKVKFGEGLSDENEDRKEKVCVLGESVAEKHFKNSENAIGKKIKISGKTYTVVGVYERKGDGAQGINTDQSIFIPYSTAYKYVYDKKHYVPQGVALVNDINNVDAAMIDVKKSLEYIFDTDSKNFMVENAGSKMEAALASSKTMNILLLSVGTIVFIVGGIGIMNVLFVTVKERTKEIGILKALGSSSKDILIQFLLESIIISSIGGVIGIIVSYLLAPLTGYLGVPVIFTLEGKVIAFLFAIVIGTVFGFYPAYEASKLKPVEALSYE